MAEEKEATGVPPKAGKSNCTSVMLSDQEVKQIEHVRGEIQGRTRKVISRSEILRRAFAYYYASGVHNGWSLVEKPLPGAGPPPPKPLPPCATYEDPATGNTLEPGTRGLPVAERRKGAAAIALTVPCTECRAAVGVKCENYKGKHCAPHRIRMQTARGEQSQGQQVSGDTPGGETTSQTV